MMQGPEKRCIVVRDPEGTPVVKTESIPPKKKIWTIPFLRGIAGFAGAMSYGVKALMYSAEVAGDETYLDEEPSKLDQWIEKHFSSEVASKLILGLAVVLGIGFSVCLFILLPTAITGLLGLVWKGIPLWFRSVVEGILKVSIFMTYLALVCRMKEMRRVFSYHGAEHKAIYCYENGLELTVENVRKQPRHHPRCGTSFLFVVIVFSIFFSIVIFTPLEITNTLLRMLLHLLMLPIIVGITYEFNRYVGRHSNLLCRVLRRPGMWMQNFTTFEPDDSMIEVAILALKEVLPEEKGADRW
jgi:uncharacterized protein YqhQ